MKYEAMKTSELRTLVRERGLASGSSVASARKEDLINLLNGKGELKEQRLPVPETQPRLLDDIDEEDAALAKQILDAVKARSGSKLTEDRVIELIQQHGKIEKVVKNIRLKEGKEVLIEEHTHEKFERVLQLVSIGLPVLMVGPAGTGKTTLAAQIAKAMDKRFSFNSMSAGCSESHIIGRTLPDSSGNWSYKPAPFVTTYKEGGVHLFDEIDASDPNLLVLINSALANGHLSIPFEDMIIEKHKDTSIVCAANTYGNGASRQYVGRNALDKATLDRFATSTVEIGYDKGLEKKLVGALIEEPLSLLDWVWSIRKKIEDASLRRIMSTRTAVNMAIQISAKIKITDIQEAYFTGWSEDERKRVA